MKEVLFVLLDQYADWEAALVAAAINDPDDEYPQKYCVKTLSPDGKPIHSIGGFTVLPDYSLDSVPEDFAALLLIGGYSWKKSEADACLELVISAVQRGAVVGAICGATGYLGRHGLLNSVSHTSNSLEYLKQNGKQNYTGEPLYIAEQAVSDNGIVTANGTAHMEFAKEVLTALDALPLNKIDEWYDYLKLGQYEAEKKQENKG